MSTILKDTLHPRLQRTIKDSSKCNLMMRTIKVYMDKNTEVLYASGPTYRLFMSDEDREFIFKNTGVSDKEINDLLKKIDDIDEKWTIISPFNILATMMIREAELSKNEKVKHLLIMSLTLSLYSSLQFKYFRFLPNKAIMDYTINNMTNKYLIKKYAVLYKAIEHIAMKNHETYTSDLIRGEDLDVKNYIMNLRTRLNNFMKIIANEYIKNSKEKKYLNTEQESRDEENYVETSNISLQIEKLLLLTDNKFYSSSINPRFVRIAADMCSVHGPTLDMAMKSLKDAEDRRVSDLIRRILKIYLANKANSFESLKTRRMIPYCLQVYSKSNIKDQDVIEMKKLLDDFLMKYCNRYTETEREATRVSYRKAVYVYFLLHLQSSVMTMH